MYKIYCTKQIEHVSSHNITISYYVQSSRHKTYKMITKSRKSHYITKCHGPFFVSNDTNSSAK